MWFDRKKQNVSEQEEPRHWDSERVLTESNWGAVTLQDVAGMDNEMLEDFADLCEVDSFNPEDCVPCAAHVEFITRTSPENLVLTAIPSYEPPEEHETPKLDALMQEPSPFVLQPGELVTLGPPKPTAEQFADQVRALMATVEELLEGPPIPPPNVSTEELALLTVAAQKWLAQMDAMGMDLAPQQAAILTATRDLVGRLNRG